MKFICVTLHSTPASTQVPICSIFLKFLQPVTLDITSTLNTYVGIYINVNDWQKYEERLSECRNANYFIRFTMRMQNLNRAFSTSFHTRLLFLIGRCVFLPKWKHNFFILSNIIRGNASYMDWDQAAARILHGHTLWVNILPQSWGYPGGTKTSWTGWMVLLGVQK